MFVVDTNVLVYAADADSPFHAACRKWLERQRESPGAWYTTWPVLYEFLRVTTHARVMRSPWRLAQAWSFVRALLAFESVGNSLSRDPTSAPFGIYGVRSRASDLA